MKTNIIVNLDFTAIHRWRDCPINEVSFLRYPHRHTFKIECKKEVNHADRDIEIIMFKQSIYSYLHKKYYNVTIGMGYLQNMSCEMLASELLNEFKLNYCKVMEDGENGAEVIS